MCRGTNECPVGWAKNLTPDCPPSDAEAPGDEVAFRMAGAFPPTAGDFRTQHELGRTRYPNVTECEWRGLSLWNTVERCEILRKFKVFRASALVQVTLVPDAGAVARRPDGHITWWQCAAYDPVAASSAPTAP
jgi:hypothetical protein